MKIAHFIGHSRKLFNSAFSLSIGGFLAYNLYSHYNVAATEEQRIKLFLEKVRVFNEELRLKDSQNSEDSDEYRILTLENSSPDSLTNYSLPNYSYHKGVPPIAVFYPASTEEVSQMVKLCNELGIPITAYGRGTSAEGSAVPLKQGVIIDFKKMDKIKNLYKEDFQISVEPGIQWMNLNDELEKDNLFFPMDPGPGASIGGMINTNCSGTNAVKYGTMKDWIINLTVVLPDGRIIKTANRAKKSSAGYNLNSLFCGSEGTLGIVTEATIKLAPLEKEFSVFDIAFDDVQDAIKCSTQIIQAGIQPAALEFLDDEQIKANNASSKTKLLEKQHLLIKVVGSELQRKDNINRILEITKKNNGMEPRYAIKTKEASEIWMMRRRSLWSTQKLRPGAEMYITDVCVPISKLAESIKIVKEDIKTTGILATIVGHVGDGNYHLIICVDHNDKEEFKKVEALHERLVETALKMEGTCAGEHGVGIGKRKFLVKEKQEETLKFMKELKTFIDPKGIFNPGKIFFLDEQ